ncbi:MAG: acyl carrier protein [Clostridia bacterium]|nr:acyl carrier protein [Clostridia bacterium]
MQIQFAVNKWGGFTMNEKILALLQSELPDIDFNTDAELVSDGILDSLSITTIIAALTMEFGITIPYEDIVEENFNSVDALAAMVRRLM